MDNLNSPLYKRVVLKMSGEALIGDRTYGIDPKVLTRMVTEIGDLAKLKVQVGLVIGGGNFFRGKALSAAGIERITADYMGMLGTIINALAMREALEQAGYETRILSAIPMSGVVDPYDRRKAIQHLNLSRIVLFAGGTGNPLVTTDSAASLRAIEANADILLKATSVDGVYSADPSVNKDAKLYKKISYQEVLKNELGVMDLAAFTQCRDHNLKLKVFNMNKPGALRRVIMGEDEGTLVEN